LPPYFDVSSKSKETIKKSSNRFISFIKHAFSIVQSSRISLYSCKYSRRDFTQHQLLTLILFKEYRKEDYRTVIWNLEEMDRIREVLGLTTIPHFTTLQKFLCRIKSLYFDLLLKNILKQFYSDDGTIPITAIDSSGFTSGYCSHYYSERTGKIRKHFLKTSIAVDTDQQIITGFTISKSRVHDSVHAFLLLKKCHKYGDLNAMSWTGDTTPRKCTVLSEKTSSLSRLFLPDPGKVLSISGESIEKK